RQPVSLGESACNKKIRETTDLIEESLSIEFKVGFIYQNCSPRSRMRNTQQVSSACHLTGWIVGIRNHNQTGTVIQVCKHIFRGKRELLLGKNWNRLRPRRTDE